MEAMVKGKLVRTTIHKDSVTDEWANSASADCKGEESVLRPRTRIL